MILIPLSNSDCCVSVSDRDSWLDIFVWRTKKSGSGAEYIVTACNYYDEYDKKHTYNIRMHRMIMNCWDASKDVHHKDHNRFNCERDNLEVQDAVEHKTKHNQMVH